MMPADARGCPAAAAAPAAPVWTRSVIGSGGRADVGVALVTYIPRRRRKTAHLTGSETRPTRGSSPARPKD
eukprot:6146532-Prymnesium_polylepis.1